MVDGRAIRRGTVWARRDRIVGGRWVRPCLHGVVRRVLNGRRRSLHVRSLRMGEHARRPVAAGGIVTAWNHAGDFRRRKITEARRVLLRRHGRRRAIVRYCTIGEDGRRYRHGRVVVGTRRGRIIPSRDRINSIGINRLLLHVHGFRLDRGDNLCHFASRCTKQPKDDWVGCVCLRGTLTG